MSAAKTASSKTSLTPSPVRAEHSVYAVALDCRLNDLDKSGWQNEHIFLCVRVQGTRVSNLHITGQFSTFVYQGYAPGGRGTEHSREGLSDQEQEFDLQYQKYNFDSIFCWTFGNFSATPTTDQDNLILTCLCSNKDNRNPWPMAIQLRDPLPHSLSIKFELR